MAAHETPNSHLEPGAQEQADATENPSFLSEVLDDPAVR